MSTSTPTGLDQSVAQFVAAYTPHIEAIPEPPETFLKRELPEQTQSMFNRLNSNGVIKRVEYDSEIEVHRWRLNEKVMDALERFGADPQPGSQVTPCCGYQGFSNLHDGGFECGFCNEEFDDFHVVEEFDDE